MGALTAPTSVALSCQWRSRPQHQNRKWPLHSITSSAQASSVGDISRPSAFAVFRLTDQLEFGLLEKRNVAGFAPLRILSTRRSEERRVGKECATLCRSWWS